MAREAEVTTRVFISLGSNLDNPLAQLERAVEEMKHLRDTQFLALSPWYQSKPIGPPGQADYINGAVKLDTCLQPLALLDALQAIETRHHRKRGVRWGPRTLDLDIILFGDRVINDIRLTVPHPELANRNFVLYPLADLDPQLTLPDGTTLNRLLANVPATGIVPLSGGG